MTATSTTRTVPGRDAAVTLREVTAETVRRICDLRVAPDQESFVAPNATSIAEAHFSPRAWFRAIYADDTPVGFVMLEEPDPTAADPPDTVPYLWRLMIAADGQRRGFGRRALDLVLDDVRTRHQATALLTSCVPGDGSPCAFYRTLGFVETGEIDGGEIVMRLALPLAPEPAPADAAPGAGFPMRVENAPTSGDIRALNHALTEFNLGFAPDIKHRPLAIFLRDPDGTIAGGIAGATFWGWLYVELLWLRADLRGHGHGSRLLAAAEAEAVRRGCRRAYLDTFEFQAPTFYKERGYRPFGELPDFTAGHTRVFLSKALPAAGNNPPDDPRP